MTSDFLIIGLVLVCAKLLEGAAVRFKQSSLLAYLVVGIILGIWFEPGEEAKLFFEVGVLFLFFLIGIDEIDISGFVDTLRGRFFVAALVSFAVPFAANLMVFLYLIDLSIPNAVTLASLMGLSSLGIAARVLGDLGKLKDSVGLEIFTTVVIIEIVGLLVAGFALEESAHPGGLGGWKVAVLLGEIILFVVASWVLSSKVVPRVLVSLRRIIGAPQLAPALMVGSLFLVVWGAHEIGMDEALAALVFGMVNSGLPRRLRNEILPSIRGMSQGVFIPLFFASAGTHVDLSFLNLPVSTLATVVPVVIIAKAAGSLLGVTVARVSRRLAVASGIMGKGVIEIAFLHILLEHEVISREMFSLLTLLMIAFIFAVPPLMGFTIRRIDETRQATLPTSIVPSFARFSLQGLTVDNILEKGRRFANANLTVQQFMELWAGHERQDYVVTESQGKLAGTLSLRRVRRLPQNTWPNIRLSSLVNRRPVVTYPDEPLDDFLEQMAEHAITVFPVVDRESGALVGSVGTNDVLETMLEGEASHSA